MSAELTLTLMSRSPEMPEMIRPFLDRFEKQTRVRVRLEVMLWHEGRGDLNRIAFAHQGPDISEVGTTWVNDLVAMNALRPFSALEVNHMGRKEGFVASAWESSAMLGDPQVWAIPWTAEVFLMHYRKDLLEAAGLDPQTALASPAALDETARRLRETGLDVPVGLPLRLDRYGNLHCLAPFLWHAGTHFIDEDGKTVLFSRPEALQAVSAYYGLLKHCSVEGLRQLNEIGAWEMFRTGKIAVAFGSQGMTLSRTGMSADIADQVGAMGFQPHSFVGGSNLVAWNHTRYPGAAIELVRFLTSEEMQLELVPALNSLPARLSTLQSEAFHQDPLRHAMAQALQKGRSYPPVPLWGMMEERLSVALVNLWETFYTNPAVDLDAAILQELEPLARRLAVTFSQYKK